MKVEALKHTDVRGKNLYYIRLSKGTKNILKPIGEKTYNEILDMEKEPEQGELPLTGSTVVNTEKFNVEKPLKKNL